MTRFRFFVLSTIVRVALYSQVALADEPTTPAPAPVAQDENLPKYAPGKAARALGATAGAYAVAGAATFGFLALNFFCDQNGDLINIGCETVGFPVVGVFLVSGLAFAAVAPSAGHLKAGDDTHAYITTGIRLAGATVLAIGLKDFESNDLNGRSQALMLAGGITLVGTGLYDIVDAGFAPRRVARKQHEAIGFQLSPSPLFSRDGQASMGLLATGHF